jgi:hypothetical protein
VNVKGVTVVLTNFALAILVASEKHAALAVWQHPSTAVEALTQAFAGLHPLHDQILAHRLRDAVEIFTGFQALFRQKLDLSAPIIATLAYK